MSGDIPTVSLAKSATDLVATLSTLSSVGLGRWALVGGLAVLVRLNRVHRATADIDAVVDESVPPDYLQALTRRQEVTSTDETSFDVGGVTVEVLRAEPAGPDEVAAVPDVADRLFVAGLLWALETANPVRVTAIGSSDAAVVPVASPGALLAMKLHAIIDRRGPGQVKRASDGLDLYELLTTLQAEVISDLQSAPDILRLDTATVARKVLIDWGRRTSSWVNQLSTRRLTSSDLAVVARTLLEGIEQGPV